MSRFTISVDQLDVTFAHFRDCGGGQRECQVLWVSPWNDPGTISQVVHSAHHSHAGGFDLDSAWLNLFWLNLAERGSGVRVQVHTHPHEAFHSSIDDAFPIVHAPGFLSLVIPNFGMRPASLDDSYLCEIAKDGSWVRVCPKDRIVITT